MKTKKFTFFTLFIALSISALSQEIHYSESLNQYTFLLSKDSIANEIYFTNFLSKIKGRKIEKIELRFKEVGSIPSQIYFQKSISEIRFIPNDTISLREEESDNFQINLAHLKQLKVIEFSNIIFNKLVDLSANLQLEQLILRNVSFQSQFEKVYFLKKLKKLNLANLQITHIPNGISKLKNLEELYIQNCSIAELPADLYEIKTLKGLYVVECLYLDSIPPALVNLKNLEFVSFMGTPIKSNLDFLCNMKNLKFFSLSWITEKSELPECFQSEEWKKGPTDWEWYKN